MIKHATYNKILILFVMVVFTLVNLSVVSNVFCYMKDSSSCCCKQKTETKSCCSNKQEVKFTSHCGCEMKEAKTEPAELIQSYTVSNHTETLKIFTAAKISFSADENIKVFSVSKRNIFHSPPSADINTLKCVLRI